VAAKHTDATGHETWCEVVLSVRYEGHEGPAVELRSEV